MAYGAGMLGRHWNRLLFVALVIACLGSCSWSSRPPPHAETLAGQYRPVESQGRFRLVPHTEADPPLPREALVFVGFNVDYPWFACDRCRVALADRDLARYPALRDPSTWAELAAVDP